jgi:uncharacterized membrane protein (UPF0127 family)
MDRIVLFIFGAACLLALGCSQPPAGASGGAGPAARPAAQEAAKSAGPESKAQSKLPMIKLWVGPHVIDSEIAATPNQRQMGMMYRTSMGEMEGMIFIFNSVSQQAFWMRNTTVPWDVAYIDPDGKIREIYPLETLNENTVPSKSFQIQYVLEMNQGWFEKYGVKAGMTIRTEKGTFSDTFFGRR